MSKKASTKIETSEPISNPQSTLDGIPIVAKKIYSYPEGMEDPEERSAFLKHKQDQWKNWSDVLHRIKNQEQVLLSFFLIIFSGFCVSLHNDITKIETVNWKSDYMFIHISYIILIYFFGFLGLFQAINLRAQYYRSMVQMNFIEYSLTKENENDFKYKDFEEWRDIKTRPRESKIVEILLFAIAISVVSGLSTFWVHKSSNDLNIFNSDLIRWSVFFTIFGFIWPLIFFPYYDKIKLRKVFSSLTNHTIYKSLNERNDFV